MSSQGLTFGDPTRRAPGKQGLRLDITRATLQGKGEASEYGTGMPEVIIIGAGVTGMSIAYHLAKLGCRDVLVLERDTVGSGSTDRCAGGIRQQFATEANVRLSMESVRFFERFEEETGHPADFRQNGYLLLATTPADLNSLRAAARMQRGLGVPVDLLTATEVAGLVPGINVEDVLGASYCPTDGYADPYSVVSGFASAAKKLGVRVREDVQVTGIETRAGTVRGVRTTEGSVFAPAVVNAAGPHAGIIASMAGLDLPVRALRRHIFVTEPVFRRRSRLGGLNRADLPLVADLHNGFWFRREGLCLIFGMRNPDQPEGFSTEVDWGFLTDTLARVACHRLPSLSSIGITRARAGLHSDTPDYLAILGEAPEPRGLYLACGFSGHGFMHSPAVGRLMANLILEKGTTPPELEPFHPERFQQQIAPRESAFI